MTFGFAPDISRDLTVGLQAVSASFLGTTHDLLPQGIFTFIDSTVPSIWLPLAACQQFEKVFGLTWDETTELYLVNVRHIPRAQIPSSSCFARALRYSDVSSGDSSPDIFFCPCISPILSNTDSKILQDTLHTTLLNNNASFTFSLGNSTAGGSVLNITLPYASFDLSVSWPVVANTTRYFPIMRAANDTQYTLGRAFLQEA
jgi:hypothetical protein